MRVRYVGAEDFLKSLLLYFIASYIAFFLTSGGWVAIMYVIAGWIPFVASFVIAAIGVGIQHARGKRWFPIDYSAVAVLIGVQIVALLLNQADNGDAPGSSFFLERIVSSLRGTAVVFEPYFYLFFGAYVVLIVAFVVWLISRATVEKPTTKA